jgi:[ribosomal protein S5]-alanine N-acetyltransferase
MHLIVNNAIHLSAFLASDRETLVELLQEKEIFDRTLRIPYPYTLADADNWLSIAAGIDRRNGQTLNWAIRDAGDRLIGGVGLETPGLDKLHRAEIGYWLGKPFWGQGIMSAVVETVCRHGFDNLDLQKITAHVFHFNTASARVLEKTGFQREGYLPRHYLKNGQFIDAIAYGLLRS